MEAVINHLPPISLYEELIIGAVADIVRVHYARSQISLRIVPLADETDYGIIFAFRERVYWQVKKCQCRVVMVYAHRHRQK